MPGRRGCCGSCLGEVLRWLLQVLEVWKHALINGVSAVAGASAGKALGFAFRRYGGVRAGGRIIPERVGRVCGERGTGSFTVGSIGELPITGRTIRGHAGLGRPTQAIVVAHPLE